MNPPPSDVAPLIGALLIGLAGNLHCIGMCGPIARAMPTGEDPQTGRRVAPLPFAAGRLLYNLGRVVTYTLMGAVFGLLGQLFSLAGWRQGLSLAAGVAILLAVAMPKPWLGRVGKLPGLATLTRYFRHAWGRLIRRLSPGGLFLFGLLNGLLPCGLVYFAVAGATAMGSVGEGMLFMALFGVGTVPAIFGVSLSGKLLTPKLRFRLRRAVPIVAVLFAVLFILRGLSPGIPYVSPQLDKGSEACPHCHAE